MVELECRLTGGQCVDVGTVQEQRPGDLRAAEPHGPVEQAVRHAQDAVHPQGGGVQAGQDGVAQVQLAQARRVQNRDVLEVAVTQAHGVVDVAVLEVERPGDPRTPQSEGGGLPVLLRSAQQQGPQHGGPYGPFGSPIRAPLRILVRRLPEVHVLPTRKGAPHPLLGGCHIVDLHQRGL
ncbi:hypothetical protein GCM10011428_27100 [Streptomyces violaceus]